jgi:hypothetical protein
MTHETLSWLNILMHRSNQSTKNTFDNFFVCIKAAISVIERSRPSIHHLRRDLDFGARLPVRAFTPACRGEV